jgi:hypothetical protein
LKENTTENTTENTVSESYPSGWTTVACAGTYRGSVNETVLPGFFGFSVQYAKRRVFADLASWVGRVSDLEVKPCDVAIRYHDALHLAFAAYLAWSPITRGFLKRKRGEGRH